MKTGIITTDTYLNHDTGHGHPERADRVTAVIDSLKKTKSKNLVWQKAKKFDLKYLQLTHGKDYLNSVKESFPTNGLNFLDNLILEIKWDELRILFLRDTSFSLAFSKENLFRSGLKAVEEEWRFEII